MRIHLVASQGVAHLSAEDGVCNNFHCQGTQVKIGQGGKETLEEVEVAPHMLVDVSVYGAAFHQIDENVSVACTHVLAETPEHFSLQRREIVLKVGIRYDVVPVHSFSSSLPHPICCETDCAISIASGANCCCRWRCLCTLDILA